MAFFKQLRMIGSYPIDLGGNGMWSSANGKTTVNLGFTEKLTNKDFAYDYTINARDLDPHNPLLRLYLGQQSPYSQFLVEAHRTFRNHLHR